MVKCCRTYEEVYDGDVGKVIKLDRDGLHDLNVQCDWQQKGGTYWVRYIHIELLGERAALTKTTPGFLFTRFESYCFLLLLFFFTFTRIPTTNFSLSHKDRRQSASETLRHHAKVQVGLRHPPERRGGER